MVFHAAAWLVALAMIGRRGLLGGAVSWWASGNAREPLGPQAREAQRLDRRVLGTSRAGVGPAPQPGQFIGRVVVVFGTGAGTGFFEYSGRPAGPTPGPANPPVAYATPPGVTTDPFGNTLPATGGGFVSVGATGLIGQFLNATIRLFLTGDNTPALVSGSGGALVISSGKNLLAQTISVLELFSSGSPTGVAQAVLAAGGTPTPTTTALLEVQGAIQSTGLNGITAGGNLQSSLGDIVGQSGNLLINTIGKGLRVKEGSGAKQGAVLLAGGTATVLNSNVTAASRIFLTAQDNLSTGALRISARTAGTSFTITSSVAGDSGSVAWEIFEPA